MTPHSFIELKCEFEIPFHDELNHFMQRLANSDTEYHSAAFHLPHKEAITQAMRNKLVYVKLNVEKPTQTIRPRLLAAIRKSFNKELVGTIRQGDDDITFILL
ncbi:hypothetical protein [Flavobacterium caeni]|uniref:Uncharacterized protein n=1 Tax=Flavobacterium caeni TaxID=490189 RepID=A0A1G5FFH1_9FLAO|nr:hypothetical protein [Flavobacterium caeni]SCY37871.1 hypothetical protein SAMN02927903_01275 [Flavobacterium caeni]